MKTDNNHKYYTNSKGEHVLRVTDVIKTLAKDQLMFWANMLGFKHIRYKDELDRTANIGSLCHSVLEQYFDPRSIAVVDFDEFHISDYGDRTEVMNALDSFFDWYKQMKPHYGYHVKFTELVVVDDNLGGTIDCGIDGWKDPNKVIFVDYKTSKDFYLTQFLQLSAYTMIYENNYGKDTVEGIMVICLDKTGSNKAKARFISRKDLDPFILCFQCLYDVAVGTRMLESSLKNIWQTID